MEHRIFCKVFDQIEQALAHTQSASEVKLLASLVEGLLRGHAESETALAYAALDHALADRGALHQLYQDHSEIDEQYKRIQRATEPKEALHHLRKALEATRNHFRREEKIVFPVLEKTLQPETLRTLGGHWLERDSVSARA